MSRRVIPTSLAAYAMVLQIESSSFGATTARIDFWPFTEVAIDYRAQCVGYHLAIQVEFKTVLGERVRVAGASQAFEISERHRLIRGARRTWRPGRRRQW